jgi:hypothetical protein
VIGAGGLPASTNARRLSAGAGFQSPNRALSLKKRPDPQVLFGSPGLHAPEVCPPFSVMSGFRFLQHTHRLHVLTHGIQALLGVTKSLFGQLLQLLGPLVSAQVLQAECDGDQAISKIVRLVAGEPADACHVVALHVPWVRGFTVCGCRPFRIQPHDQPM